LGTVICPFVVIVAVGTLRPPYQIYYTLH